MSLLFSKVGSRVAIEPGVPCRMCLYCKSGRYNLCKDMVFCATPPVHGSLRRYYKHAADFCFEYAYTLFCECHSRKMMRIKLKYRNIFILLYCYCIDIVSLFVFLGAAISGTSCKSYNISTAFIVFVTNMPFRLLYLNWHI